MSKSRDKLQKNKDQGNQNLKKVGEKAVNIDDSDVSSFFSTDPSSDNAEPEFILKLTDVELKFTEQCETQQNPITNSIYNFFSSFFRCSTSHKNEIDTTLDRNMTILKPKNF